MPLPRPRVAAYVVRTGPAGPELLVLADAAGEEAGTQVPAGGIEAGEEPAQAAVREVAQEAGIEVEYLALLGRTDTPCVVTGEPRDTTYVLCRATTLEEAWDHLVIGTGDRSATRLRCWFAPLPLPFPLAEDQGDFLHLIG